MTSINLSSISSQISSTIYSKLDTSKQGYLDATSLSSALSGSSDGEVSDLVSSLDTDGDSKITQSELSKGIENLFNQLQSASNQASGPQGMPPPPPGAQGDMPPPPPPNGEDQGLTKDQMQEMAANTDDSKLKELLNTVSSNFEAADTDGDGKVKRDEAMAYQQSQNASSSSNGSTSASASNSASSTSSQMLEQIAKLIQQYAYADDTQQINASA